MPSYDLTLRNEYKLVDSALTLDGASVSSTVDLGQIAFRGAVNAVQFVAHGNATSGTVNLVTSGIRHSDDDVTFTDVDSNSVAVGQVGVIDFAVTPAAVIKVSYLGNKRFVRSNIILDSIAGGEVAVMVHETHLAEAGKVGGA